MFTGDGIETVQVDAILFKKKEFVWEKMQCVWSKELTEQGMPTCCTVRLFNQDFMASRMAWLGEPTVGQASN